MLIGILKQRRGTLVNVAAIGAALLCAGLLLWILQVFHFRSDWTVARTNTLHEGSRGVVTALEAPLQITAYVRDEPVVRRHITQLVERYRQYHAEIGLEFVDPQANPEAARQAGVNLEGTLILEYKDRRLPVLGMTEQKVTTALMQVARGEDHWLVFVTGHGERDPLGRANFDYGNWGALLQKKGIRLQSLNLAQTAVVPDNVHTLVVAGSANEWLASEVALLRDFLHRGGNLLWFADPDHLAALGILNDTFGLAPRSGRVVEPGNPRLNTSDPSIIVAGAYGTHPILSEFNLITVYPGAVSWHVPRDDERTRYSVLVESGARSWNQAGASTEGAGYSQATDTLGPLPIVVAAERDIKDQTTPQRVVVVGDGDMLSNMYLGNAGNAEFGNRLADWVLHDDVLVDIPVMEVPDRSIILSRWDIAIMGIGFLIVVPLVLLALGSGIWWRRKRA